MRVVVCAARAVRYHYCVAVIEVSTDELGRLVEFAQRSPMALVRLKGQAFVLAGQGVPTKVIATLVERSERTVESWLSMWRQWRMGALFTGHQGNLNASRLDREQRARLMQALSSSPSESGIPGEFWDVPKIRQYTATVFDLVYESDRSYHLLLKFAGLSFKYPAGFDRRRDEAAIEARMDAIRAEIAPLVDSDEWEVFAADEVKVNAEAVVRKAWLKTGERTHLRVERDSQSQSFIGFLNQHTFECEMFAMDWQDSDNVLLALDKFLRRHPDKKVAIVWDNAAFHKSKLIRDQLGKGGLLERVHLIAMPPYAPDHNPIEHVWNTAKNEIANIQRDTFDQTIGAFLARTDRQTFRYRI